MKTKIKIAVALLILGSVISCKQADENSTAEAAVDSTSVISSSAAVEPKNSNRKFVRTADIKFKVKNVAKSTYAIENATTKFGGFVTYTNLESTITDTNRTKISQDSTLEITKYTVVNNIIIRVPNTQLDTVIKTIAKEIGFLNYRKITADDVSIQMLANKMANKRSEQVEKRVEKAIDNKGKKLNQIIDAEENLDEKKAQKDNAIIENLTLNDKVNFSTLTIDLYQPETIKKEMIVNEKSSDEYRPNIGLQIWDSLKTGWFILEGIIAFVVQLWSVLLLLFLIFIGYKKFIKK